MRSDILLVGLGGQGILTIGELLASAAQRKDIAVNFFPSRGMAQRGGFVKAELRLGQQIAGPHIPEKGADLVIAMEVSEALKAVRFIKPGGDFILLNEIWKPTAVVLGKKDYPAEDFVKQQITLAGARLYTITPQDLHTPGGEALQMNMVITGLALQKTNLNKIFSLDDLRPIVEERWRGGDAKKNWRSIETGFQY